MDTARAATQIWLYRLSNFLSAQVYMKYVSAPQLVHYRLDCAFRDRASRLILSRTSASVIVAAGIEIAVAKAAWKGLHGIAIESRESQGENVERERSQISGTI